VIPSIGRGVNDGVSYDKAKKVNDATTFARSFAVLLVCIDLTTASTAIIATAMERGGETLSAAQSKCTASHDQWTLDLLEIERAFHPSHSSTSSAQNNVGRGKGCGMHVTLGLYGIGHEHTAAEAAWLMNQSKNQSTNQGVMDIMLHYHFDKNPINIYTTIITRV